MTETDAERREVIREKVLTGQVSIDEAAVLCPEWTPAAEVVRGAGVVPEIPGRGLTAMTVSEVISRFEGIVSARDLDAIIATNLSEDEIDGETGIISQATVALIARVVDSYVDARARQAEASARILAAWASAGVGEDLLAAIAAEHALDLDDA